MSSERINRDELFMGVARLYGKRSSCPRAQVGAVAVRAGRIITCGYVGSPPGRPHCLEAGCIIVSGGCSRTIHAEANAIAWAARIGVSLEGASLYTTMSPCPQCAKLLLAAGIAECVYELEYRDDTGIEILAYGTGVIVRAFEHPSQKANLDSPKKLELH